VHFKKLWKPSTAFHAWLSKATKVSLGLVMHFKKTNFLLPSRNYYVMNISLLVQCNILLAVFILEASCLKIQGQVVGLIVLGASCLTFVLIPESIHFLPCWALLVFFNFCDNNMSTKNNIDCQVSHVSFGDFFKISFSCNYIPHLIKWIFFALSFA